jgi:hypothetical protein
MTFPLEYHKTVQRSNPASLALFGMFLLLLFFVSSSRAQINGAPPTGTSPGFGGHAISGTPPTATIGHSGIGASHGGANFHSQISHSGGHHRHHTVNGNAYYPYVYAVPVPYAVDLNDSEADAEDDDSDYQGGPTVFDRRGSGPDSYIPPTYPGPAHARQAVQPGSAPTDDPPASESSTELAPEPPQPSTILVFKDGHQEEVGNYAIVSQTLYELTPGRPRKIALADLDLSATQKENDDRGNRFQLPPSAQVN